MTENDIYHQIWECDPHKLTVSARYGTHDWENPDADILLDEQVHPSPNPNVDLAPRLLFYSVNEEKVRSLPTYRYFIQLLDNYRVNVQAPEIITLAEKAEIYQFLEAVLATQPMELAYQYIRHTLNMKLSWDEFGDKLYNLWFQPHKNHFGGHLVHGVSGFEHTFAGEGRHSRGAVEQAQVGRISGYHSWIKLYLDEKRDRVNFLGYTYGLHGHSGSSCPYVIIVHMEWNHPDPTGNTVKLFKKNNSFFVGTSPECELAMGTVAFYESLRRKLMGNRRRAQIRHLSYDLILNRSVNTDGSLGHHIHSFYPLFVGNGVPSSSAPLDSEPTA